MEPKPLDVLHDRATFDCGVEPLNDYLRKYALQNQKKDAARTYVITREETAVIGYYTLVFGSVSIVEATPEIASGLGKYPIPIILLARLAVDKSKAGKGLGKILLKDALLRTIRAADIAGLRAILTHAKDDEAKQFYQRFGFQESPIAPLTLMLDIRHIRASLI